MRQRSQTIGSLGRAQARTLDPNKPRPPADPQPPKEPPKPDRGRVRAWLHDALFENTGLKFLSLVLAVTVFLLITTDEERDYTVRVPVKYDFPHDKFVLVSEQLQDVRVTLKGPWRRLRDFHERELGDITLDLRDAPTANLAITPDMIRNVPPKVKVTTVSPQNVYVAFDNKVQKVVEILPVVTGRPQHGYAIDEIKATPPTVTVRGGQRIVAALTAIKTTEVSIEGRTEPFEQLADLVTTEGVSPSDATQKVVVSVRFKVDLQTRLVPDVAVVVKGDGIDATKWKVVPPVVEVTLTGPLLDVEATKASMIAKVVLAPSDKTEREVKVSLDGVKEGVGVKISRERVTVKPATAP
jgi:YbbR domain-containing protein